MAHMKALATNYTNNHEAWNVALQKANLEFSAKGKGLCRGYVGGIYWGYMRIMEKRMETIV